MENNMNQNTQNREELTIKFAKGLVGQPFTAKTGRECVAIKIPNEDPADKRPWESIVVAANHVHEDKFGGKGVWMKVPADGQTKVSRSELTGTDENGKNVYTTTTRMVSNAELKQMMESYKNRDRASVQDALKQPSIPGAGDKKPRENTFQR